jgi:hypothetical protein
VDSYLHYASGPTGECEGSSANGGLNGRNFHVAQLGVQCPVDNDNSSHTAVYNYDDYFFEGSAINAFNFVGQFDNRYTVYDGTNCGGEACTVRYDDVYIQAESHNYHHCIQPVGSGVTVPPGQTMEELREPSETGFTYSAQFEANWRSIMDGNFCNSITGMDAPVRITCLDNAQIEVVQTLEDSVNCESIGDSVLECVDANMGNGFTGVVYVSFDDL